MIENGNKASWLFLNLNFQELRAYLHLLGYYSLPLLDLSVDLFIYSVVCIAIFNSSWLSMWSRKARIIVT